MLDWLACILVRAASRLLCRMPPGVAVWLGERGGLLAYWLRPKRTMIGLLNLRAAFDGTLTPGAVRRTIRACYKQLGAGIVEMLRLPAIDRAYLDRYVAIEGRHHIEQAAASGQPTIFLTGHYGNWELCSIAAALQGYPIVALARAQANFPRLYTLLVSYRQSKGCTIIHKGGAMKQLVAALEQRRFIGIVADQASRQGIFVDFFGRPALFATGPFDLAYGRGALIVPAFMRRLRGPFHRLVIEPPIQLSREQPKADAVRSGIERFAAVLARHIRDDPHQWLWMHKRWKHTPARRVLVLSDGKPGHLKQSLAVVDASREHRPELAHEIIDIRFRYRWVGRAIAVLWGWWMPGGAGAARCLRWVLAPEAASALLTRYADLIISCGSSVAPVTLLWAAENRARSIVVMDPAPLPVRRFGLVIAPRHDGLPRRPNVVQTIGAVVTQMPEATLREARNRLQGHPKFRAGPLTDGHPVIAVFIGGESRHYDVSPAFAEALAGQVAAACDAVNGWCLVTTSRRTSPAVERVVSERLSRSPRCRLLLIASRDQLDLPAPPPPCFLTKARTGEAAGAQAGGTMEGMVASADVAVVTGESISMVSEVCASGRHVVVVEPPLRGAAATTLTKHQRFLRALIHEGYARMVTVPEVGLAIQRALAERRAAKRLDTFAAVHDAVGKLL